MGKLGSAANAGLTAANLALAIPVVYLGALTVISGRVSRRTHTDNTNLPVNRFVVLVPAHNEETTIATILASMTAQRYPESLFAVHVVADNCTDNTAEVARANGAVVHERVDLDQPG